MSGRKGINGPWRALDPQEIAELKRLHANERVPVQRLAERYGVSTRTVWRYLASEIPTEAVQRIGQAVDRWADLYAFDLRPQERRALVELVASTTERLAA